MLSALYFEYTASAISVSSSVIEQIASIMLFSSTPITGRKPVTLYASPYLSFLNSPSASNTVPEQSGSPLPFTIMSVCFSIDRANIITNPL